ncbi:hypothetical protein MPSEU_000085400 [Mayamaea pseudoterrestris]|nr:hypothetical protein MPSEU_000085400 [Mayamaea pseudoterrestris]
MPSNSRKPSDAPCRISNAEALEMFKNQHEHTSKDNSTKKTRKRTWIEQRVVEYLEASPCTQLDAGRRDELKSLLQCKKRKLISAEVQPLNIKDDSIFSLSDHEVLQILDFMPSEEVDFYLMVNGFQDMSESKKESLIELVASFKVKSTSKPVAENKVVDETERVPLVKAELLEETI